MWPPLHHKPKTIFFTLKNYTYWKPIEEGTLGKSSFFCAHMRKNTYLYNANEKEMTTHTPFSRPMYKKLGKRLRRHPTNPAQNTASQRLRNCRNREMAPHFETYRIRPLDDSQRPRRLLQSAIHHRYRHRTPPRLRNRPDNTILRRVARQPQRQAKAILPDDAP